MFQDSDLEELVSGEDRNVWVNITGSRLSDNISATTGADATLSSMLPDAIKCDKRDDYIDNPDDGDSPICRSPQPQS